MMTLRHVVSVAAGCVLIGSVSSALSASYGGRNSGGDSPSTNSEDRFTVLQLPPIPSKNDVEQDMVSIKKWETVYDFVVLIVVSEATGGEHRCSGVIWQSYAITAARCSMDAASYVVHADTGPSDVTKSAIHPNWQPLYPHYFDLMVLTLSSTHVNRGGVKLGSVENAIGSLRLVATMGGTAYKDGDPVYPARPVVSDTMHIDDCPPEINSLECIGGKSKSPRRTCYKDVGAPWLYWDGQSAVITDIESMDFDYYKPAGFAPMDCRDPRSASAANAVASVRDWLSVQVPTFMWTGEV